MKKTIPFLSTAALMLTLGCADQNKDITLSTERDHYAQNEEVFLTGSNTKLKGQPKKEGFMQPAWEEEYLLIDTPMQPIKLKSRDIIPTEKIGPIAKEKLENDESFHAIIQVNDTEGLDEIGINIDEKNYLPNNAYLASIDSSLEEVINDDRISHIEVIQPEDKIELTTNEKETGGIIFFHEDVELEEAKKLLSKYDLTYLVNREETKDTEKIQFNSSFRNFLSAKIPAELIQQLAKEDLVYYLAPPTMELTELNLDAREVTNVNYVNNFWEFKGKGVGVLVYDGGPVHTTHIDFTKADSEDKRIHYIGDGALFTSYHATHVACTVLGNGKGSEDYDDPYSDEEYGPFELRGMAPLAWGLSDEYDACEPYCLYESPQTIEEEYLAAIEKGVDIATNSIGSNACYNYHALWMDGVYETTCSILDTIIDETGLIIFFANGNERGHSSCDTYDSTTVPATAKNVISVGAVDDDENMAYFSSWGPTDDGRLKPEIVATGVDLVSCINWGENEYTALSGTSMATPTASGGAALVVEALKESYYLDKVHPALMRAILFNTTKDLGRYGPDYEFGHGLIDVGRAIETAMQGDIFEGNVSGNTKINHHYIFVNDESEIRATLAWIDPAASPFAEKTLVNDLDMVLVSPSGDHYHPFILDPENPEVEAKKGINYVDNNEQILVDSPENGWWDIQVRKKSGLKKDQNYFIAYSLDHDISQIWSYDSLVFNGYLQTKVQKKDNNGIWKDYQTVIENKKFSLTQGEHFPIYKEWVNNGSFRTNESGEYRIISEVRDENGDIYVMDNDCLRDEWYFEVE